MKMAALGISSKESRKKSHFSLEKVDMDQIGKKSFSGGMPALSHEPEEKYLGRCTLWF